ncbi:MAG: UDP-N-acetylmuramoyl-tripeptide--D-alanyl-D-alanine ligase [Crocinitomicaceae bacterium]
MKSNGITTDTRKLDNGAIFFALKGANFNGNEFASKAIEEGCSYAVVDEQQYAVNEKCILVDNVLKTLQDLANFHRKQFDIPVLGITGSNGKTTTKELIGAVLAKKYNLLITEGNLNNHLGVPFTLLRLTAEHDFAVIEMGANKPGDIQELAEIAEPNYGIITNVGAAHIEGFGSLEGVIKTKTELYRWIDSVDGKIFVNAEDPTLIMHLPDVENVTYGVERGDVQGELLRLTPFVVLSWQKDGYRSPEIKTKLVGRYNFTNFLAAITIGDYFEIDRDDINHALEEYTPSNNRSQVQETDKNTLIVDCYNANATSMAAAINSFAEVEHSSKLAILGDMLELGPISQTEHQKIVDLLNEKKIEAILVGAEFSKTTSDFTHFNNVHDLIDSGIVNYSNQLILLKGSRGIKLEQLIPLL